VENSLYLTVALGFKFCSTKEVGFSYRLFIFDGGESMGNKTERLVELVRLESGDEAKEKRMSRIIGWDHRAFFFFRINQL